ncbi:helix-turn-helix domain-containing protein [Agrobacterium vitis]
MSHDATNWAIRQRGLKPAAKLVLWQLCDRYHPDNGCFPSQERLAYDCELSRSSLNVQLEALEEAGLIARRQRRQQGSNRQQSTFYSFAFERDFVAKASEKPCPDSGHGQEEAVSRKTGEPCPENGESRVQNLDSNSVREPVREPVTERERERESAEDKPGTAEFEKRVQRFCNGDGYVEGEWRKWAASTLGYIMRQFANLSSEERLEAEKGRDAFLAKCRRDKVLTPMPVGNYFRDKAWRALSDADRKIATDTAARKSGNIEAIKPEGWAPSFSPSHAAKYFQLLLTGPDKPGRAPANGLWFASQLRDAWPSMAQFWQQSDMRGGVVLSSEYAALAGSMEFLTSDSQTITEWKHLFREKGWPELKLMASGGYMPKGGPQGLDEFERAARSLLARGANDDAA